MTPNDYVVLDSNAFFLADNRETLLAAPLTLAGDIDCDAAGQVDIVNSDTDTDLLRYTIDYLQRLTPKSNVAATLPGFIDEVVTVLGAIRHNVAISEANLEVFVGDPGGYLSMVYSGAEDEPSDDAAAAAIDVILNYVNRSN